eukprot:MONOS_7555.1-p1 / transcript=MONOS_7555.1 / gene=MONOS_7555 / organism=Monocercomonoides_exilis_PA203 / gene_product=unspecified product / transcript_product=unspecified product / location=Mono_scaffold00260:73024-73793(-) / protein_length=237 / sequence_SO=supercontig / SO=protein_coding / is_pseudo=false
MNEIIDEMNVEEFENVFTKKMLNTINKMIEIKKLSMKIAIVLLRQVGYCEALKNVWVYSFCQFLLCHDLEKMMIDENEKKDEKDEMLLIELCECFAWLNEDFISKELFSIIMPCLLKAASKKEENEEVQKEVEMSWLALSCINENDFIEQKPYYYEIKEIIEYHREHHNLTRLAYQSAWKFLIYRSYNDESFRTADADDLHFVREAAGELEELTKCVDWKREKGEKGEKERGEELT